jgi:large subunit ribosomal protein L6
MSKIGKNPIIIPDNVDVVKIDSGFLEFKGANGSLKFKINPYIKTEIKDKIILFSPENNSKQARANWGTIASLTRNAIAGVAQGFNKNLEIEGVGYRVAMEGEVLVLNIGLSHPVKFPAPDGIKISVEKNVIKISGADKDLVGRIAAKIRSFKKPEPYKGKGIRYQGEVIRRKAGKKLSGGAK